MSNNLNLDQVLSGQTGKEATINTALGQLDAAFTEALTISLLSSDVTATLTQFRQAVQFIAASAPSGRSLTFPALKRLFTVRNTGVFDINVKVGSTTLVLASGTSGLYYADGTANGLTSIASGGGGGGGGSGGTGLSSGVVGSHRYWKLSNLTPFRVVDNAVSLFTMNCFDGVTALTVSASATDLYYLAGSFPASNLFDGNNATLWAGVTNCSIWMDFGSAVQFNKLTWRTREATSNYNAQTPASGDLSYSDDGIVFTNVAHIDFRQAMGIADAALPAAETNYTINLPTTMQGGVVLPARSSEATARTLALADANKFLDSSSASAITFTIPLNATVAFPLNTEIAFSAAGAGQVTVAGTGGVTLQIPSGLTARTRIQYSVIRVKKIATDTWRVFGDLST
jgi:hypothetical protein